MGKRYKIILGIFILLFGTVVFLKANQPEPVDWTPSYSRLDKVPLGTYVLYESLEEKFPDQLHEIKKPPFKVVEKPDFSGTYFFLNHSISFGKAELNRLLQWTKEGNTVFIAAKYLGSRLMDTLDLKIQKAYLSGSIETRPLFNFSNPILKLDSVYDYQRNISLYYFSEIDTATQTVLGITGLCDDCEKIKKPRVNFIEAPFGKGRFLILLAPEVFSNYFMLLENNSEYAEKALSYINTNQPIYWDARYKIGRSLLTSPLSVFLGNKYLKWAYYLILIGVILFVFFEGKRKQRSLKIIPPLTNKTREFTDTVAGMYLDKKDHKAIAEKKISLFLEYVRIHFQVDTQRMDKNFVRQLAQRSGKTEEEARSLFQYIAKLQKEQDLGKKELKTLNHKIEAFKDGK